MRFRFLIGCPRQLLLLAAWVLFSGAAQAAPGAARVLVFGDSLSAAYGIGMDQGWPSLLAKRLLAQGSRYSVHNASVSGETTAGGLARLPQALTAAQPTVVILALGANDGLRGLPVATMQANLDAMVRLARRAGAQVLLVGMRLPPNYGPTYNEAFEAAYRHVAAQHRIPLLPFLLEPIARDPGAFQADHLHPVAAVQGKLLDHLWPALQPLLARQSS